MAKAVQRRRGTTAEHATFTGALAELTVDTSKDTVVVHDGALAGGYALAREDLSNVAEIPVNKLADGAPRQLLQTAGNGLDVQWTNDIDVPGTLDVTGAAVFDSSVTFAGNVQMTGTGYLDLPVGTTAQRPGAPNSGMIRFNADLSQYEGYNGTAWASIGGGATGGGADTVFIENSNTVTTSYTLSTNKNAVSAGPVTVNVGAVITVPSGASWVIV